MTDVAIVGGGPAGLHAAALLARHGVGVALYEEHAASGTPVHCTGVLATEAFDEFDLPRNSILNTLHTARFYSPAGSSVSYTTERIEAVAVDRLVFDQILFARAAAAGASLHLGARVSAIEMDARGVLLRFKQGEPVRARALVLACGANYVLQRRLGLGMPAVYMQSAQIEVPASAQDTVELHFGRTVAPDGFAWAVPIRRSGSTYARIGLMCTRHAAAHFRRFAGRLSSRWGLEPAAVQTPRCKLLPLAPIPRTYADRVLAIGDAAGLVKATTGGGIYYSLLSASLAAETLTRAFDRGTLDARILRRYEQGWQQRLGAELRAQLRLRTLAHDLNDADIEAFFDLARTDGVMPLVRQTARFNQHRNFIVALLRHSPARRVLLDRLHGVPIPGRVDVSSHC